MNKDSGTRIFWFIFNVCLLVAQVAFLLGWRGVPGWWVVIAMAVQMVVVAINTVEASR